MILEPWYVMPITHRSQNVLMSNCVIYCISSPLLWGSGLTSLTSGSALGLCTSTMTKCWLEDGDEGEVLGFSGLTGGGGAGGAGTAGAGGGFNLLGD